MRSAGSLAVSLLLVASIVGCATGEALPDGVIPPRLVVGILEVPALEATSLAQLSVMLPVGVINDDIQDLTVESLQVESIGVGPYTVFRSERRFNHTIKSGASATFEMYANAQAMTTIDRPAGQEGNIQIRVIAYLKSPSGAFKRMEIQSIGTRYAEPKQPTPRKD